MNSELLKRLLELKMTLVDELIESLPVEKQERIKSIERDIIQTLVETGQAYLDKTSETPLKNSEKDAVTPIKVE